MIPRIQELRKLADRASSGELAALEALDAQGLLTIPGESAAQYRSRLETLFVRLEAFLEEIAEKHLATVAGETFIAADRIPRELFDEAGAETARLYGFRIDWVPGFYRSVGISFGGAAFTLEPGPLNLFLLRPSFRSRKRWFIYSRRELMAHELCHVARHALRSDIYEEQFAYQTSETRFRRSFGSLMRSAWESYALMTLMAFMLASQAVQTWALMQEREALFTIARNTGLGLTVLLLGSFLWLFFRQHRLNRSFQNLAATLLAQGVPRPLPLLFRLSDQEIAHLARLQPASYAQLAHTLQRDLALPPWRAELLARIAGC